MPHFLINKDQIKNDILILDDKETIRHLACSFRIKEGEKIKFIDKFEMVYFSEVISVSKNKIECKIIEEKKSTRKLNFNLSVAISILKPEAFHLAIQNAVQLGTKEIYPVISDNIAVKKETVKNKADKWQKIGMEAFKQCERADIPTAFDAICGFGEVFSKFKKENIIVFAEKFDNCNIKQAITTTDKNSPILAVFGPEGGFSDREFEYFQNENIKLATLGNLILKAPNAVTAGLYGIVSNYEN